MLKLIKYIFIEINHKSIYEFEINSTEIINFLSRNGFETVMKYGKLEVNNNIISYDYLLVNKFI